MREFIEEHRNKVGVDGHRLVVRNEYLEEREITIGIGHVKIKQPRVDDHELGQLGKERFNSKIILRPYCWLCQNLKQFYRLWPVIWLDFYIKNGAIDINGVII